jgi:hypothetical protein
VLGRYFSGGRPPVPPVASPMKRRVYRGGGSRLAAGVAAAGACVLLAACSPVKAGAAAVVGSQRITQVGLASQVSVLNSDLAPYSSQLNGVTQQDVISVVLGWLITFQVQDRLAASEGITVTPSQANDGLGYYYTQVQAADEQNNLAYNKSSVLPLTGVPSSLKMAFGQFEYQQLAFEAAHNGGKLPSTSAENTAAQTALAKASCHTEKSLNVQVNPQYGQLTSSQAFVGAYSVAAGADKLSQAAGPVSPTATPTASLPSC